MADIEKYILNFNFSEFHNQFHFLTKSYTDFGEAIHNLARNTIQDLTGLKNEIGSLSSVLTQFSSSIDAVYGRLEKNTKSVSDLMDNLDNNSKKLQDTMSRMGQAGVTIGGSPDSAMGGISDITAGSVEGLEGSEEDEKIQQAMDKAEEAREAAIDAGEDVDKATKTMNESKKQIEKDMNGVVKVLMNEVQAAKGQLKSTFSQVTGGLLSGGGLFGMLIGFMLLGYKEKDRIKAEAGEMLNVFEAMGGNFMDKTGKKAVNWFAGFAERAQFYFGIGRKETQAVVKDMIDFGMNSEEIMNRYDKSLGLVGRNVVTLSLGLDKHLNLATGTSSKNMLKVVAEYGDELDVAADKYMKLSLAAQRSGIGIEKFINSVMAGSSAVTQYGIDIKDAAEMMTKLQRGYEEMGLNRQFSGTQASNALSGMMSGVANFSDAFQIILMQKMSPEIADPLESRQKFKEGWSRVAEGKDSGFMIDVVQSAVAYAKENISGGRAEGIFFLERQGMSHQAASAAWDFADKFDRGADIQKAGNDEMKALRKAFQTEGKQVSDIQKNQRHLIEALRKVGEGILTILTSLLSTLIVGFKSISTYVAIIFEEDKSKKVKMLLEVIQLQHQNKADLDRGWDILFGTKDKEGNVITEGAISEAGGALGNFLPESTGGLKRAMDYKGAELDITPMDVGEKVVGGLKDVGKSALDFVEAGSRQILNANTLLPQGGGVKLVRPAKQPESVNIEVNIDGKTVHDAVKTHENLLAQ